MLAPTPGRMPIQVPMMEERNMLVPWRRISDSRIRTDAVPMDSVAAFFLDFERILDDLAHHENAEKNRQQVETVVHRVEAEGSGAIARRIH